MADAPDNKYKGGKGPVTRQGLGRLRRAGAKPDARFGGWERRVDDDAFLEQHGDHQRGTHSGESLLAKFNRLARDYSGDGESGEVAAFAGSAVVVRRDDGSEVACVVRQALKKRIKGVKNPLAVGDRVRWEKDGDDGAIVAIEPRRNQLARADSHNKSLVHVLAANVDRLVVVTATARPEPKPGFIDRYLVIAAANAIPAVVVINKCDLAPADRLRELYAGIGYAVFATAAADGSGLDALRSELAGTSAIFAGQSGVGKSSLINALFSGLGARVAAVATSGLGRHTTTASRSYLLPDGGRLVDTPGIRECGITGLAPLDVALLYPDIARWQPQCRFTNCTHLHEPDCAVLAALERGELAISRYESYASIVEEDLAGG